MLSCVVILFDRINSSFISGLSAITKILVLDILAMFGLVVIAALGMMAGIEIPRTSAGRTCTHSNASFIDYSICANIRGRSSDPG